MMPVSPLQPAVQGLLYPVTLRCVSAALCLRQRLADTLSYRSKGAVHVTRVEPTVLVVLPLPP